MSVIHFLNVDPGDCTIIQHNSGRVSLIDICDGFTSEEISEALKSASLSNTNWMKTLVRSANGNFKMKDNLTNPVNYLKSLDIKSIFRFILTHPDMDHMDGLSALAEAVTIANFWDTGVKKKKPNFSGSPYREEDWDKYIEFVEGKGTTCIKRLAGEHFQFANKNENGEMGGDGLYILAPDKNLVEAATENEDANDASYIILYRSGGGRILLPGDAHDASWEYVLSNYENDIANCSVMIAPHHGRHSDRSFEFLDIIEPKLTLFGNAPSEHLAYDEWNRRNLPFITSNQAGNIVLESHDNIIKVFIENISFAKASGRDCTIVNSQGYVLYETIKATEEVKVSQKNSALTSFSSNAAGMAVSRQHM